MKKTAEIKNRKQLLVRKAALQMQVKEIEQDLHSEVDYINSHIQPIFNIVEYAKSKISPVAGGVAKVALPLIIGKIAGKGAKTSVWGIVATLAAEYVAKNVDIAALAGKFTKVLGKKKNRDDEQSYDC